MHEQSKPDSAGFAKVRFFIPGPSSRFFPSVREFLHGRGVPVESEGRKLRQTLPGLDVVMARGFDIPDFIADGWGHLGLTGIDAIAESGADVEIVAHLGIRHSTVVFASATRDRVEDLQPGDLIINEYPNLGPRFFADRGVHGLRFREVSGAAESLAMHEEVAGMVTLKTSGASLQDNGLKIVDILLETHACLAVARGKDLPPAVAELVATLSQEDESAALSAMAAGAHLMAPRAEAEKQPQSL